MKKKRLKTGIHAGSMADIAFLLLIFFLVTTEIMNTKGIQVIIPDEQSEKQLVTRISKHLSLWINSNNELLFNGTEITMQQLSKEVTSHLNHHFISSKKDALILLNSDAQTDYEAYVNTFASLKQGIQNFWAVQAEKQLNKSINQITRQEFDPIKTRYAVRISEVEKY